MILELRKDIRQYFKYWLVFFFMLCLALVCLDFLPGTIAVHWNAAWQADNWGAKWAVLEIPLVDIMALTVLQWIFTGLGQKFVFGSRIASDSKGFLYHCWLIVSLFLCTLEMLMLAQGFHTVAGGPRFLCFVLSGSFLLLAAAWNNLRTRASWTLETVGLLLMLTSIL